MHKEPNAPGTCAAHDRRPFDELWSTVVRWPSMLEFLCNRFSGEPTTEIAERSWGSEAIEFK
ncbi:MAG: hypothetical protein AUK47_22225 [Deltaproteobacteria bacterium CG2_30_63_29]|nr:MAG: hypothetical protein AUK47_22225 [Deltaproteobacteria bacterium CG2_30_63_29]